MCCIDELKSHLFSDGGLSFFEIHQHSDKEMTETELVEAANSSWSLVVSALGFYMTIASAYLIAAFLAGVKFTTSQVGIISALFITMASTLMIGLYGWTVRGSYYTSELAALNSDAAAYGFSEVPIVLTSICSMGVLASFKFMWDIRHPQKQ
ncbi:MAG: positive regulator of sigma E activity [Halieaceae bacterium]